MRENFSKGIRKILKLAKEEAVRLSQSSIGSEHLLLGVLKDSKGNACLILKSIGIDIEQMKLSIEEKKKRKREYQKKRYQNMTDEQKERRRKYKREYQKNRRRNRTDEQKTKYKEYQREYRKRNPLTEEQKETHREYLRNRYSLKKKKQNGTTG